MNSNKQQTLIVAKAFAERARPMSRVDWSDHLAMDTDEWDEYVQSDRRFVLTPKRVTRARAMGALMCAVREISEWE